MQVDEEGAGDVGAHAFGPTLHATLTDDGNQKVWLTVVERTLVPSQVDVSSFMARMGELLGVEQPALVPIRLVDREADFCVVGYEAMPGAVPLQRRIEGTGSTAGLVARVAVEVARGLAHLHAKGRVHGGLAPGNIVLWRDGVSLWQHGLAVACSAKAIAPKFRALGGDVVAPEVRGGAPPAAVSDVYTWGAVVAALATDTVGSAALAAVEDGELDAGLLTPVIVAALSTDAAERPADGLAVLRAIAEAPMSSGSGPRMTREAELRELAGRYVEEVEGGGQGAAPREGGKSKRRQFRRTATELYPPGLEPIAGVMIAPDEPEPDPFTVPTDAVAPADVHQEEPERVPTPAPMQITARRIEDEPARRFNPDALTPPDGARLGDLEDPAARAAEETPVPAPPPAKVSPGGVSLPPLVVPTGMDDGFSGDSGRVPTPPPESIEPIPPPPAAPPLPAAPPPMGVNAPIPPPPMHDDMSPEDSGFGLSIPVPEALDSRLESAAGGPGDSMEEVVGALAAATSSPHLSTVDGVQAEVNPALEHDSDEAVLELELELPESPSGGTGRSSQTVRTPSVRVAGHTPAPIPAPVPPAEREPSKTLPTAGTDAKPAAPPQTTSGPSGPGSPIAVGERIQVDAEAFSRPKRAPNEGIAARPMRPTTDARGAGDSGVAPAEARGPRGSTMAALIGFGATILAVGLTVPVAQERGGLSVLLGQRAASAADTDGPRSDPAGGDANGDAGDGQTPPPAAPTTCPDDTTALPGGAPVCIDRGEHPGLREYPTTDVTHAEAAALCEAQGRRLCTAKEWRSACKGPSGRRQPYAGPRKSGHCNDALDGVPQALSRGGARETCVTPEGVFDLVGNAGEWVAGGAVLGGDATTTGASCQSRRKVPAETHDAAIGFRCCVTLAGAEEPAKGRSKGKAGAGGKAGRGTRKRKPSGKSAG